MRNLRILFDRLFPPVPSLFDHDEEVNAVTSVQDKIVRFVLRFVP
jgi:hypothetical protein